MKKLLIILMFVLALVALSAVSAADNATEIDDGEGLAIDESVVVGENQSGEAEAVSSEISAEDTTGYEQFSTTFTVTLTGNGTPLESKPVSIQINGMNYTRTTDAEGKASVSVNLDKGTYDAIFSFAGDNMTSPSNGTAKITVKAPYSTKLAVADKDINYRQGLRSIFTVRLLTASGAAVKNQTVTFKVNGKTYTAKTDSKGYASIYLSLKKGSYKVYYSFKSSSPYLSTSGSSTVKVKAAMPKGYGYWMWAGSMKKVSLKTLKKKGTKHIFLHSYVFSLYGKSAVKSWIAKAGKYGIKVHIWMQVFYSGKWVRPVNDDGSLKYSYMLKKIKEAKSYAKIKGVAGVHLDYVRFGGTAMHYDNAVKAINYFVKKACVEVRKVAPNCILSASVMPEPGALEYYYGQDVSTMSKYLDVIIPMAYKGNYGKTTSWVGSVTKSLKQASNGAQIWTGLQAYKSDSNLKKLPFSTLLKDAKISVGNGANGVVLFRIGLTNILNFNKV